MMQSPDAKSRRGDADARHCEERRVGKATRVYRSSTCEGRSVPTILGVLVKVGTAQARLCPPYVLRATTTRCLKFESETRADHSMLGSTRSGGLWLSRKVLILMITFSPISTRPSIVAEPICGKSETLPCLASRTSFGLTAGSFS